MSYINSTTRQKLDPAIEALAQAVAKNTREGSSEYSISSTTSYAISKVSARILKLTQKEVNNNSIGVIFAALNFAKSEFYRRIAAPFFEKQKALNGEIFGEIL